MKNARDVRALPDPLGEVSGVRVLDNGLRTERRRVPLGVLLLIYESRPNATVEAAGSMLVAVTPESSSMSCSS